VKVVWRIAAYLGLASIVFGLIDHFLILSGRGAALAALGSPGGFLEFAMSLFLFAIVLLLYEINSNLEGKGGGE